MYHASVIIKRISGHAMKKEEKENLRSENTAMKLHKRYHGIIETPYDAVIMLNEYNV